jgi:hypothetical protein
MNEQKLKNRKTLKPRGVKIKLRQGDRENKKKNSIFILKHVYATKTNLSELKSAVIFSYG